MRRAMYDTIKQSPQWKLTDATQEKYVTRRGPKFTISSRMACSFYGNGYNMVTFIEHKNWAFEVDEESLTMKAHYTSSNMSDWPLEAYLARTKALHLLRELKE